MTSFAHAVRPRHRQHGQSRARLALYLLGRGKRLCPPTPQASVAKKIFGPHVTQADPSRHVFREWSLTKEMNMTPRLNTFAAAPAAMKSWLDWSTGILKNGLEDSLMELVKIRASQINGCAVCLHMHTAAARKHGESEERLYLLDAWRESPLYSERERAALAWTEALTLVSVTHAPDDVYRDVQAQFTEQEQVTLTLLIVAINGWNRVQVGFRAVHPVQQRQAA
jgi:AhpD family alkylhydroperoxidase